MQRQTRSNKNYDIGTLIRKRFPNHKHYEGGVTSYDPTNRLYRIKYLDGDNEDFTPEEMKKYYHHTQRYTQKTEANAAGGTLWDPELNKIVPLQGPYQALQPCDQAEMAQIRGEGIWEAMSRLWRRTKNG